jgi:hypothetical protein
MKILSFIIILLIFWEHNIFAQGRDRNESCRVLYFILPIGSSFSPTASNVNGQFLKSSSSKENDMLWTSNGEKASGFSNGLFVKFGLGYTTKRWAFSTAYSTGGNNYILETNNKFNFKNITTNKYVIGLPFKAVDISIQRFLHRGFSYDTFRPYLKGTLSYKMPSNNKFIDFRQNGNGGLFSDAQAFNNYHIRPEVGIRIPSLCGVPNAYWDIGVFYNYNISNQPDSRVNYTHYENNDLKSTNIIELPGNYFGFSIEMSVPLYPQARWAFNSCPTRKMRKNPHKISDGEQSIITVKTLKFKIGDYQKKDGDIISLYINGKLILDKYNIKNKKKLKYKLNNQNNQVEIKVYAHNEGKIAPNTPIIKYYDGHKTNFEEFQINTDQSVAKTFIYKKRR